MYLPLFALLAGTPDLPTPAAKPPEPEIPVIDLPLAQAAIPFLDLPLPATMLPASVRLLVDAAYDGENDQAALAILQLARQAHPGAQAQIAALEKTYRARQAARLAQRERDRVARLTAADWTDNWTGQVELGGSRSTGNTDLLGVYGSVQLDRNGLNWTHALSARLDFQQSDGRTVANRLRLDWQPGYKVRDGLFVYGLGQYERDPSLGFRHRLTASAGFGFTLVSTPSMKLDLLGGPALRHTVTSDDGNQTIPAGRASLAFNWQVSPTLRLTQDVAAYVEGGRNNAVSTSALETQLVGNLKARLSYDLQYERNDMVGRKPLDTTSRATLAYSF